MANLTANRAATVLQASQQPFPARLEFPLSASAHVYAGQLIGCDASTGGYATVLPQTSSAIILGVCVVEVDNTSGSNGDKYVKVENGVFSLSGSGITLADCGKRCYSLDDHSVTTSSASNRCEVGRVFGIAMDGQIKVRIVVTGP